MLTRRNLIKQSAWLAAGLSLGNPDSKKHFKIGACDWSLGKNSDPAAFAIAKEIGLDGLMIDMGTEENNLHLRKKDIQQQYRSESKRTGIAISSIAIGALNNIPYKSDPRTEEWVWDSVEVAKNLSVPVVLLAFFHVNDLRNDGAGKKEVVKRLKKVMPHAEKNNIILGIESYLNADEHKDIIDQVGSKNLKVYYDFRNTADAGFDALAEFKKLGRDLVCELHIKENDLLLGKGTLDWKKIGQAINDMNYFGDGWMQIEGARPDDADVVESYKQNLRYLRQIFSRV